MPTVASVSSGALRHQLSSLHGVPYAIAELCSRPELEFLLGHLPRAERRQFPEIGTPAGLEDVISWIAHYSHENTNVLRVLEPTELRDRARSVMVSMVENLATESTHPAPPSNPTTFVGHLSNNGRPSALVGSQVQHHGSRPSQSVSEGQVNPVLTPPSSSTAAESIRMSPYPVRMFLSPNGNTWIDGFLSTAVDSSGNYQNPAPGPAAPVLNLPQSQCDAALSRQTGLPMPTDALNSRTSEHGDRAVAISDAKRVRFGNVTYFNESAPRRERQETPEERRRRYEGEPLEPEVVRGLLRKHDEDKTAHFTQWQLYYMRTMWNAQTSLRKGRFGQ